MLHYPTGSTTADGVYGQGGSFTTNDLNHGGLSAASLAEPDAVAVDGSGGLYVADNNNRVLYYSGNSTARHKVIVFIGGVCTAVDTSTSPVIGGDLSNGQLDVSDDTNATFHYLQALLRLQGYTTSDFLAYSYNGGTMVQQNGVWRWEHYAYNPTDPINSDWTAVDPQTLDVMLQQYQAKYPNTVFVLVGHSLGGVVALQEEWNNVLNPSPTHAFPYQVLTIDSPLHGVTPSIIDKSIFLSRDSFGWRPPGCSILGQAATELENRYEAGSQTTQLLSQVVNTAIGSQGVARIDNFGNNWDCLWSPNLCGIPVSGDASTQWITGAKATVHNQYTDKEDCTSIALALVTNCVPETHGALLSYDGTALRDIINAIGPQT